MSTAIASGTGDAIAIPLLPCTETTTVLILTFQHSNTITTPTISVNGQTPHVIHNFDDTLLTANFFAPGQRRILTYNGINWLVLTGGGGGTGGCTLATSSSTGCVEPDNVTITVNGSGVISTIGAGVSCTSITDNACLSIDNAWLARQRVGPAALTDGSSIAVNAALRNAFTVTLTGNNHTLANPTNLQPGTYIFMIIQDGTGGRTGFATGAAYKFPGGVVPFWSTTANAVDRIVCYADTTARLTCDASLDYR